MASRPTKRTMKPGTQWRKRSNQEHVATVIEYRRGVVTYTAHWSKFGVLRKCWDSFLAHYRPIRVAQEEREVSDIIATIPCSPESGALQIREPTSLTERMLIRAHTEIESLRAQLAAAEAERDREAKNAERYRFLRDKAHTNRVPHIAQWPDPKYPQIKEVGLDAAIDAAIASAAGEAASS